jgi:hypothetical protein
MVGPCILRPKDQWKSGAPGRGPGLMYRGTVMRAPWEVRHPPVVRPVNDAGVNNIPKMIF